MTENTQAGWLDVLKAALWPLFAIVVLIVFGAPLSSLLDRVSRQASGMQEITIGPLKIQVNIEAAKTIAPPSEDMARSLSYLTPEDIDVLLSHREGTGRGVCTVKGAKVTSWRGPVDEARTYLRFSEEGMVEFSDPPFEVRDCPKSEQRLATLTEFGVSVRRYLLKVITTTLTIGEKAADA